MVKLRSRAMPPPGARRPDNAAYAAAAGWLESALDLAATAIPSPDAPPAFIGSIELNTRMRFAICSASRSTRPPMLPPDSQAGGFDTNADALSMEPALLDRYLTAAAKNPGLPSATPRCARRWSDTQR